MLRICQRTLRISAAAGVPIFVVAGAVRFRYLNDTTIALALLFAVVASALAGGWVEPLVAATASGLALAYYFIFTRGTPLSEAGGEIIAFVVFLITAVSAGQLSAYVHRERDEAVHSSTELEKLNRISGAMSGLENVDALRQQIAGEIAEILGAKAVEIYDKLTGQFYRSGGSIRHFAEDRMCDVAEKKQTERLNEDIVILPLRAGLGTVGSIAILRAGASPALLSSVADKVSAAITHAYAVKEAASVEIERRSEELKSALMDAMAHESLNALFSIKMAVTYLLSQEAADKTDLREMLAVIEQSADYLTRRVNETLEVSHADVDQLRPRKSSHDIKVIISAALKTLQLLMGDREVRIETAEDPAAVECDAEMIQKVVELIVENAVKYSPALSTITISAERVDGLVVVKVSDKGPGVDEDEQVRIFERNYRGRKERTRTTGSGLGLASAKRLIEAHGGEIWVTNAPEGGAVFQFSLPTGGL